tara:strand:+ start:249 stop:527 length:279 start_codon:yes stop_codon:yes gene_type:complete
MAYQIKPAQRTRARAIGVSIKPSKVKGKKLDVFKGDKKVASIGALGMGDYETFKKTKGLEFANKRRKAYKSRHGKTRTKVGTPSYYADKILW